MTYSYLNTDGSGISVAYTFSIPLYGSGPDCDHVTVYKSGQVFHQRIDFYPEYWLSDGEDYDINNCGWEECFDSVGDFLEDRTGTLACSTKPEFKVIVAEEHSRYTPHSRAECSVKPGWLIPNVEDINGFSFWLRCFFTPANPEAYPIQPIFDAYYPVGAKDGQAIEVLIKTQHVTKTLAWVHGQRGLFDRIVESVTGD